MSTTYFKQMTKHFNSHSKVREYCAHQTKVHSVAWSCDGRKLASGSFDKTVTLFSLDRDRLVWAILKCIYMPTMVFLNRH